MASSATFGSGASPARRSRGAVESARPCRDDPGRIETACRELETRVRGSRGPRCPRRAASRRRASAGSSSSRSSSSKSRWPRAVDREARGAARDIERAGPVVAIVVQRAGNREPAAGARDAGDARPREVLPLVDEVYAERPGYERARRSSPRTASRARDERVSSGQRARQLDAAARRNAGERARPFAGDVELDAFLELDRGVRGECGVAERPRDARELEPAAAVSASKDRGREQQRCAPRP